MAIDEFLYIYNDFQESETEQFYTIYGKYSNSNNIQGLIHLRKEIEKKQILTPIDQLKIAEISARIDQLESYEQTGRYSKKAINNESLTTITNYLATIQTWTLEELRFFANTLDYVDYEEKVLYFNILLQSIDRYASFNRGKNVICTLLVNEIYELLLSMELSYAEILMQKLWIFTEEAGELFFRNFYHYYKGLLLIAKEDNQQGETMVQQAIKTLDVLGHQHLAKLLTTISEDFHTNLKNTQAND